ncbi:hypothetical protein Clacol_002528 [Clathrus columnatus]|uniref:Cyclin N-terminal domain-containing protein n=1 Tax=Clathrus columnatus TaxID=1419009 RepID=A0AAV5A3X3_9AGAM|nr:hypothetical protein Clacol_002528 [Clathrus columnatus]
MATNRLIGRRAQRGKIADENATAQGPVPTKSRLSIFPPAGGAQRIPIIAKGAPTAAGTQRSALGEVTINHRKDANIPSKPVQVGVVKRGRSSSMAAATAPQRIPAPPALTSALANKPAARISRPSASNSESSSRPDSILELKNESDHKVDEVMEIEAEARPSERKVLIEVPSDNEDAQKAEVEKMVIIDYQRPELHPVQRPRTPARSPSPVTSPARLLSSPVHSPESARIPQWPAPPSPRTRAELQRIQEEFTEDMQDYDTTLVAEYSDEIFQYMNKLEEESMPGERYIDGQTEINWEMRQTLVDWLLQLHLRYGLLPETLWIAINIVDRFLTKRVVSLVKLQLVGVTAMFIAAKYEEILAPSVEEFVFMTNGGCRKDEILKGERIILQTLDFRISSYCSPYSWVRKISKADGYDLRTRTLSKFLMEVTLLDHRFLRVKPSVIAAVGMYGARIMLGGDWTDGFVYYSGYTEKQLQPGLDLLIDKLVEKDFNTCYLYKKYLNKKFLKASSYARQWALQVVEEQNAQ